MLFGLESRQRTSEEIQNDSWFRVQAIGWLVVSFTKEEKQGEQVWERKSKVLLALVVSVGYYTGKMWSSG